VAVTSVGDARHSADPINSGARAERPDRDPIFHQPWWLDAVAPGRWDAVTVERGGETVARLPYVVRGPRRLRVLTQPPLTQFLGPWTVRSPGAKEARALGDQMELQAELESGLPPASVFHQNFSPQVMGALPFIWSGYRAEVRYTYRLEDLSSEQAMWDGLAGNIRREIRKARQQLEVREDLGLDRLHHVWAKTFARQGLPAPDIGRLERIDAACAPREARAALFACDEAGRVHAVAYVVWDRHSTYYLLGGGDPELRTSGASSLLMWEAIGRARKVSETFDFEGSMLRPVERFFRAFGARQTPYLQVSRASRPAATALAVRAALRRTSSAGG
jgi:hypothetical protein